MITHSWEDDTLFIRMKGEIDHHTVTDFRVETDRLIDEKKPLKTVLDFGGISFCDSSGIALVMGRYRHMTQNGGILELKRVPEKIMLIFSMAGLDKMIKMSSQEAQL